jgi:hypothetical protein
MEGFRDIDGGSDGHDMIMSQVMGMEKRDGLPGLKARPAGPGLPMLNIPGLASEIWDIGQGVRGLPPLPRIFLEERCISQRPYGTLG